MNLDNIRMGQKIRCTSMHEDIPTQNKIAQEYLQLNKVYTISNWRISMYDSWVEVAEIPNQKLNVIFFDNVEE